MSLSPKYSASATLTGLSGGTLVLDGISSTLAATLAPFYRGDDGAPGADGANGVGVPIGGTSGQVLAKASATDYDTEWVDQTGGGGGLSPTIPAFTDVTDAALETLIESNTVVVSGDVDTVWPAVVRGDGSPEMQVNAGTWGASGIFRVGDSLKLRLTSSATGEVSSSANLYAQGVASPWVVTTAAGSPFDTLLATLLSGASQLIAHPLEYGSMFQDRAGTTPVTASGQLVGHVLDAGGGNYHATAISDAARMVFRDVDGFRWVEYNGINGAYSTPVLAASGVDKVQVFAGVRKLGAAGSNNLLIELSASLVNSGSFAAFAQLGSDEYYFGSRGSSTSAIQINDAAYNSPVTNVLTCLGDISGDLATLRIDGTQVAQSTADQGTGNYNPSGTYPLYYGARAGTSVFFNGSHYATLGPITRFSAANATAEQIEAAEAYYTARVI